MLRLQATSDSRSTAGLPSGGGSSGLGFSRCFRTVLLLGVFLAWGLMTQLDLGTAHGSCGHYVFTSAEWAVHQTFHENRPTDERGSWPKLMLKSEHRPVDDKAPCQGPGCRGGGFPMNVIAFQLPLGDKESVAVVFLTSLTRPAKSDSEYPCCSQSSGQEQPDRLLRPPRL